MKFFLHHNIVYSKSPVYNNINGTGAHIKGTCLHQSHLSGVASENKNKKST